MPTNNPMSSMEGLMICEAEVERVARAMWEDAEVRAMSSIWVMPTRFEDNRDRYMALARSAIEARTSPEAAAIISAQHEALKAADARLCVLVGPQSEDEATRAVVMQIREALSFVASPLDGGGM